MKHESPSSASVLGKFLSKVAETPQAHVFFTVLDREFARTERQRPGLIIKLVPPASAFDTFNYPLDKKRKRGTQDTGSQSDTPGTRVQTLL